MEVEKLKKIEKQFSKLQEQLNKINNSIQKKGIKNLSSEEKESLKGLDTSENLNYLQSKETFSSKKKSPIMTRRKSMDTEYGSPSKMMHNKKKRKNMLFEFSDEMEECQQILVFLLKHKLSFPFNQPVNPQELGIPDYFDVIKEPMDLGTVSEKLSYGEYESIDDFVADVRLIWSNALLYNPPGNEVHEMAQSLSNLFEKKISILYEKDNNKTKKIKINTIPKTPKNKTKTEFKQLETQNYTEGKTNTQNIITSSKINEDVSDMNAEISELRETIKSFTQKIAGSYNTQTSSPSLTLPELPPKPKRGRPRKQPPKELTREEKQILTEDMNKLSPNNLYQVVQIIQKANPKLAESREDEIEIDIDKLDNLTLIKLMDFTKKSLMLQKLYPPTPKMLPVEAKQEKKEENLFESSSDTELSKIKSFNEIKVDDQFPSIETITDLGNIF